MNPIALCGPDDDGGADVDAERIEAGHGVETGLDNEDEKAGAEAGVLCEVSSELVELALRRDAEGNGLKCAAPHRAAPFGNR